MENDTISESKEIDTLKQIARQEYNILSLSFVRTSALANRRQLESKRFRKNKGRDKYIYTNINRNDHASERFFSGQKRKWTSGLKSFR